MIIYILIIFLFSTIRDLVRYAEEQTMGKLSVAVCSVVAYGMLLSLFLTFK